MAIELNHTIVPVRDRWESARWLADLFGLPEPLAFGPFVGVQIGPTTLDYADGDDGGDDADRPSLHFAFLVGEDDFDAIFGRIVERSVPYYADPAGRRAQQINTNDGGRGCYFADPSGHCFEILTVPYGGWPDVS